MEQSSTPILVSVVVPMYNVGPYIEKCAESLFNQTYPYIEFIFINDASTDSTLDVLHQIVDKYPALYINIIDLPSNGGLAYARTVGIRAANGDYLAFCDSDDWVEHAMIERMVDKALATNADVVVTPFFINRGRHQKVARFRTTEDIADLNSIPLNFLHFSLCNKLIRHSIISQNELIPLAGIDCWEDLSVIARVYAITHNVVLLDIPLYHYRKSDSGTLSTSAQKRILGDHLAYADMLDSWFATRSDNAYARYARFLNFLKFTSKIKMLRGKPREIHRWKCTYPETNLHILAYKNIPWLYRLIFYFIHKIP